MSRVRLSPDTTRVLRHLLAAIAFRASRSLRDAPAGLDRTRLSDEGMTAGDLVLHMTNVLAFAVSVVANADRVQYEALDWSAEVERFYAVLAEMDSLLAHEPELEPGMDLKLVQGPFADALTHIGQLNVMRRKCGAPVPGISYVKAEIQTGTIALQDQPD